MNLASFLADYVHAAFSGLWIHTHEPDEADREIQQAARQHGWKVAAWDIAGGMRLPGASDRPPSEAGGDPLAPVRALPILADAKGSALLQLHNYHRFLNNEPTKCYLMVVIADRIAG